MDLTPHVPPAPTLPPIPGTKLQLPAATVEAMVAGFRRVLASERLILGAETEAFERACGETIGTSTVAVSSGTAALEIIMRAIGVAGRSVVVPANTFYATAAAVHRAGGEVVLADVGPDLLLDLATLQAAWREDTCAAVAVHIGGMMSPDLGAMLEFVAERGGVLIEDGAQSLGSRCPAGASGTIGVAGATSFYPTKIVTAAEGGILSTSDPELVRIARILRDQGKVAFDVNLHVGEGYSWRLSELHAVVGTVHLDLLPAAIARRREIAARYDQRLAGSRLETVEEPEGHTWNRYKYVVLLPVDRDREQVRAAAAAAGVGLSGEVFARPLHAHPVFAGRFGAVSVPRADDLCARHICLPTSPELTDEAVERVCDVLLNLAG